MSNNSTSQNPNRTFLASGRQLSSENNKSPQQQNSQTKILVNSTAAEPTQTTHESDNNNASPSNNNTSNSSGTTSVRQSRIMLESDPAIMKAKEMAALFKKKEHFFKLTNFSSPTFCKYCKGFIFGLFKQGFECQECGYTSHKKCLDKAQATPCEKDPKEEKEKETKEKEVKEKEPKEPKSPKEPARETPKKEEKEHLAPPPTELRNSKELGQGSSSGGSVQGGTPLTSSASKDNLFSSGVLTDATLTKKDDVVARLENLFMESQRLMMKQQFAETETDNFDKERTKLDPDFASQESQRKSLEDKLISSVNLYALDWHKRINALHNVNSKARYMLTQFEEVKKELQPKVESLKELHNKIKTTDTNDTQLWSIEGEVVAVQSLIATLEKKAAVCKELIDYNTRTISKKLAEQAAYNEILQSFVDKIEAQRTSVEKERQEAEQVANHLVRSTEELEKLNSIMKAKGIFDTQANELFPAVSQIVEKIDDANIEMVENFEFLKDKNFESDIYMVDESDKDKDVPPESQELKYINETDEKDKDNSKGTANASMLKAASLPKIKAATVDRLIERLTYPKYPDVAFQKCFLLVYRSFMTPTQLLEKLTFRYCATPRYFYYGKGNSIALMKQTIQTPVRLRVMNVVKYLVDHHFDDWSEDQKLVKLLLNFLNIASPVNPSIVDQLQNTIEKKMNNPQGAESSPSPVFGTKAPEPILPPNFSELIYPVVQLIEFDPVEIARQITIIESQMFREVRPQEFLNQSWTKKDKELRSPNLLKMIRLFNKISNWVYSEIVQTEHFMTRVNRIGKFLQIARECKKLNNFNAVFEIVAGLENSCVHRLKQTWECVKADDMASLEEFKKLNDKNKEKLRQDLHNCSPPCIPYLGMYLTDLVFIYEGSNDIVDQNLVNFAKFKKVADTIREIQQYQQQSMYCLSPVPSLQNELLNRQEMSEADAYKLSLRCEART